MKRKDREISEIKDIESVISKADVCRVAMTDDNIPYIVTLNFGYAGGTPPRLWFHCAKEGKKLDMIRKNNYVCFELDTDHQLYTGKEACDFGMKYQSVVGWGRMEIITNDKEKLEGLRCLMSHYSDRTDFTFRTESVNKTLVLRLDIIEMTGKWCR